MFTSDERHQLELFCEVCEKAAGCRFIRTFLDQPHHVFIGKLPDGRVVDQYPRYDDDDFRAFLTHYRKLRQKQDNPTQLFRIINLLKSKGSDADRSMLDDLNKEIKEEGACWWGSMHPDEGYTDSLTQERLEDLILNGEVMHLDIQKKKELAQITGKMSFPKAVALLNYMRFARTVLGYAQRTAALIRDRGYLVQVSTCSEEP